MNLLDIFNKLTTGELAQLALGGVHESGISPNDYAKIIPHINLGLTDLHSVLPLSGKTVGIDQYDYINMYKLDVAHAQSSNVQPDDGLPKYISDSAENPFLGDIIRIEEVVNEVGDIIPFNQPDELDGVFTASYDTIQIPQPVTGNVTFITYRANHAIIPVDVVVPEEIEIRIPQSHVQALLFFVASRYFASKNGADTAEISQSYRLKYMQELNMIQKYNLNREHSSTFNKRVAMRGFV